jgi:glycosyltransferase involved in cell wall biosynthesis
VVHSVRRDGYRVEGGTLPAVLSDTDVVMFHFAATVRRATAILPAGGKRVLHFHGPWSDEARVQGQAWWRVAAKKFVERRAYARFTHFVTASDAFRDVLHEQYGVPLAAIVTVTPGVDVERFTPGDRDEARRVLGLTASGQVLACVRRLEPRMGLRHLVRAMREVEDVTLLVAGAGSLDGELRALVKDLGLEARVRLLGRVSDGDLVRLYQAADASVVPTVALEGFGLVVLESMACGAPVLATRVGGLVEAMGPFADEWTVPPGDVGALATGIRAILHRSPSRTAVAGYAAGRSAELSARRMEEVLDGFR